VPVCLAVDLPQRPLAHHLVPLPSDRPRSQKSAFLLDDKMSTLAGCRMRCSFVLIVFSLWGGLTTIMGGRCRLM
jgi:hypothetical protein